MVVDSSVGKVLYSITDNLEIDGYHDMVNRYLKNEGNILAKEHDYITWVEDGIVKIERKNHDDCV